MNAINNINISNRESIERINIIKYADKDRKSSIDKIQENLVIKESDSINLKVRMEKLVSEVNKTKEELSASEVQTRYIQNIYFILSQIQVLLSKVEGSEIQNPDKNLTLKELSALKSSLSKLSKTHSIEGFQEINLINFPEKEDLFSINIPLSLVGKMDRRDFKISDLDSRIQNFVDSKNGIFSPSSFPIEKGGLTEIISSDYLVSYKNINSKDIWDLLK
jgi:hypothetical protein